MNGDMEASIVAVLIREGSRICSHLLSLRSSVPKREKAIPSLQASPVAPREDSEGKIEKGTACLPCTNSHLHACVGELNEAFRMSPDGLNPESLKRVDKCLGEIAAAERIDLAPENIIDLPKEERIIADYAAGELREIRHGLEGLSTKAELEQLAVRTTHLQEHVGREWFKIRLAKMPKEEKAKLAEMAIKKFEEE